MQPDRAFASSSIQPIHEGHPGHAPRASGDACSSTVDPLDTTDGSMDFGAGTGCGSR